MVVLVTPVEDDMGVVLFVIGGRVVVFVDRDVSDVIPLVLLVDVRGSVVEDP